VGQLALTLSVSCPNVVSVVCGVCLCVLGGEWRGLVADWHCLLQEKRPTVTGTTHSLNPLIDPSRFALSYCLCLCLCLCLWL
jgi:hypothetical protein